MNMSFTKDRVRFLACAFTGWALLVSTGNVWALVGGIFIFASLSLAVASVGRESHEAGRQEALKSLPGIVDSELAEYMRSQTRIFDGQRWRKIGKDC